MTGRRKGTPCACNTDPCTCGSSRNCVRAVNNVSPDPNGDFNIKAGTGIAISNGPDNEITIINSANPNAFVEGDNIDLIPSGDDIEIALTQNPVINGTLTVNGDIIQNGAAYETHAEHIYTRDDYIIMRDGAIAALAPGDYAGFKVKLYDGVNDGALVIDNSGTARVGDVGDEQPLLTRDEAADLTDGDLLQWDAAGMKAVGSGESLNDIHDAINTKQDTLSSSYVNITGLTIPGNSGSMTIAKYGKVRVASFFSIGSSSTGVWSTNLGSSEGCIGANVTSILRTGSSNPPTIGGILIDYTGKLQIDIETPNTACYGSITWIVP